MPLTFLKKRHKKNHIFLSIFITSFDTNKIRDHNKINKIELKDGEKKGLNGKKIKKKFRVSLDNSI